MAEIKMGDQVKHTFTDFKGVVTGICTYISGCVQIQVTARKLHDDKIVETWIDTNQLALVKAKKKAARRLGTGGPQSSPPPARH